MRTHLSGLALVAGAMLFTAACGGGDADPASTPPDDVETGETDTGDVEAEENPVRGDEELVIWTDAVKLEAVQAVAEQFAEANGITVGVQAVSDVRSAFVTANAAGNGPDVITGAHDWLGQMVQNGAVDPLQLPADSLAGYSETAVQASTYDNQLYALPYGVEAIALYCNTQYAPDQYTTLDEVIAAGQAAVDAGDVQVQLALPIGQEGDPYHMQPLFTSAGGYLFGLNADGDYDPEDLGVGEPESIAAAERLAGLGEAGENILRRSVSTDNNIALFAEGNAACLISGPWALNDVRSGLGEDGYTLQPVPGFADGAPAEPFMGAQTFMVASNGMNKAFAQEFVARGVNNEDAMRTLYEIAALPPAMIAVRDAVEDQDTLVFATAADEGAPMPAIPAMAEVWTPLGQAYAAIIGGADPEGSMSQAAQTIANAIAAS
jgi:arabinogalactan oligomer / maltooligosaccharide transport system substrate-binding protein